MTLLAVDCALDACQIGVLHGGALTVRSEVMRKGHAERVATLAQEAMAEADVGFDALTRIAVTVGPGSFAGVRVGLAFARGLAVALSMPCLGFSTLEVFARTGGDRGLRAGAIPAPDGVFWGVWQEGVCVTAPVRLSLEAALAGLSSGNCDVYGPGAAALGLPSQSSVIDVGTLVRLARDAQPAGRPADPLYLRPPYATLPDA